MKTVTLGSLTDKVQTWNPARGPEQWFDYIDLSSVDNVEKRITTAARLRASDAPSRARQLLRAGDVIAATVRPNLNSVATVPTEFDGATASTGFTVLRPKSELDARYLFHWVRSSGFISDMVSKATGASYPAVSDRIIKESPIPAPSVPEQRRIAAILDQADAIRAKRRQMLDHLDSLTGAIFNDMFGDLVADTPLADVCHKITDGTHQSPQWVDAGVPFLFVSNITSGEINLTTQKFISTETWAELTRRTPIDIGDVLYSTVGSYGIPALVRSGDRFAFQRHIAHIKPNRNMIDSAFLTAQLGTVAMKRKAARAARGIAQPTVNLADIRKFPIVLPPLTTQRAFTEKADAIGTQRASIQLALAADDELFASLQSRAFRGEL